MTPSSGMGASADLIRLQKFGFWIGTKQTPRRAVRWEPKERPDGRQTYRGKNWVEVLEHGVSREPERFYGADVEAVGPSEWLTYYPAVNEPICGWRELRDAGTGPQEWYCPRIRPVNNESVQPFCARHEAELNGSEGEETHDHTDEPGADSGGE